MSIVDAQGAVAAEYEYDPYGNIIASEGILAEINPLRYRGYYYDSETSLYYLQSRYYDPEMGRFINADALVSSGQSILGNNMFAYCQNNPLSYSDPTGYYRFDIFKVCIDGTSSGISPSYGYGAAQPYVDMPGSDDPTSPNCLAYAIGSPVNEQPGGTSGRIPTNWNDVYDVGKSVEEDLIAKGYTVRRILGPDSAIYDNEFRIALRVGTQPFYTDWFTGKEYYDYHFMRQTDTGQWAEKHGFGGASVLWAEGMTPNTIPWTLYDEPYYDSDIIYFAVGK